MTRSSPANPWQALGRQGWGAYGLGVCAMDLRTLILLFNLSFVNSQSCGAGQCLPYSSDFYCCIVVVIIIIILYFYKYLSCVASRTKAMFYQKGLN